jgi:hypothetical protein
MKLKRVQGGLLPFASAFGAPGITVEAEFGEEYAPGKETEDAAEAFLKELAEKMAEQKLDRLWAIELSGKTHGAGLYFVGDEWMQKENRPITGHVFKLISKVSVEAQRMFGIQSMSEPYMGWCGTPMHYTGMDDFYNQFNHVCVDCPLEEKFNQIAFFEQKNHAFTRFYFRVEKPNDTSKIDELYRKPGLMEMSPVKINIMANDETWDEAAKYALAYGYRIMKMGLGDMPHFVEVKPW